ncbi:MAG: nucleotide sugar dehydrogenase [Alphaproteobacteria bacterium]|nr:nucleotide sugar dehydrogenase [Alphaproteobacteria bacterium]
MRISVFGLGHVGAVTGACLADSGHDVTVVDADLAKVKRVQDGHAPVAEAGLEERVARAVAQGSLRATTDCAEAVMNSDLSMICAEAPLPEHLRAVCSRIGVAIRKKEPRHGVVLRSAGVPGTAHSVAIPVLEDCAKMTAGADFGFAINPEFFRDGTAVHDYFNPPKIVIGALDEKTERAVSTLYEGIDAPRVITQIGIAEGVKYAEDAWHALKSGFANDIGRLMRTHGIDGRKVMDILYADQGMAPAQGAAVPENLWTLLCAACAVEKKSLAAVRKCMDAAGNPVVRSRLDAHLLETRWQIKLLDACLDIHGVDKEVLAVEASAVVPALSRENLLTIKRAEICLYERIISLARKQRAPDVQQACREILEQERTMAEWIEDNHAILSIPFPVAA